MLLIDSEGPAKDRFSMGDCHEWLPWEQIWYRTDHAGNRLDNWMKSGDPTDVHLMVQMMESWFLADPDCLIKLGFVGKNIKEYDDIEAIDKSNIIMYLCNTAKKSYSKGDDSSVLLEAIDPLKVIEKSKWANRFIVLLKEK
jgi:hypothetical protein